MNALLPGKKRAREDSSTTLTSPPSPTYYPGSLVDVPTPQLNAKTYKDVKMHFTRLKDDGYNDDDKERVPTFTEPDQKVQSAYTLLGGKTNIPGFIKAVIDGGGKASHHGGKWYKDPGPIIIKLYEKKQCVLLLEEKDQLQRLGVNLKQFDVYLNGSKEQHAELKRKQKSFSFGLWKTINGESYGERDSSGYDGHCCETIDVSDPVLVDTIQILDCDKIY
jgi:hypothetical protein